MLAFLASGSRANALNLSSARTGGNSVVGRSTTTGLTSSKSANAAGSEVRRSGVRLTAKYGPSAARTSCVGSRNYCTVTVEGHKSSSTRRKYTDEDLLNNTVEANGFLILGEKEVQVDVPYWEKMTETAFNQMRFSDAVSAYDHIRGIGPNAPYLSDLHIRALDSLGAREDDILAAYRDMRQRGVKILSESYAKVLKALFKRGEKARVVSIFELMQSEGTPGTPEVYAVLLSLYYKENAKDIESALGILSTMKSNNVTPNIDVLDRLLLFFAEADRNDLIKDMYTQYVQTHKVKARRITNTIVAEAMLLENRPDVARTLINAVYKERKYPRLRTYELLIKNYLENGDKKRADEALAEMKHSAKYAATLSVYKAFFKFFEKAGDYEGLQETLARMVNEVVPPDSEILESMMKVYFDNNKNDEFLATFIQMLDRQMIPARRLWTYRMHVLKADQFTTMVTLLKEYEYMLQAGIDPNEEELRLIVQSMHEASRPDLVEQFAVQDLSKFGVKLDATDFSLLIRNYAKNGSAPLALQAYQKFVTAGLVDAEPHVIMAQTLLSNGNFDDAIQIFETIKKSVSSQVFAFQDTQPPRLMTSFVSALGEEAHPFVQQIFDLTTQHSRNAVDVDLFDTLIHYLASTNHLESALSYYRVMQDNFKIGPTRGIYLYLLESIARATEYESTTKYISTMFDIFRTLVSDPTMHPLNAKIVSTFLFFIMRHANHDGFSQAVAHFRAIGDQFDDNTLGQVEGAAIRKWITNANVDNWIPTEYIARNYATLDLQLPTANEVDWTRREF